MILIHPVIEKLQQLRLYTVANILKEQSHEPHLSELTFEERLGFLIDSELTARENQRLQARLRKAKLKHGACFEDIDYQARRGLDKTLLASLSHGQWVSSPHNLLIVGPSGAGKTFLACALAHKACLLGYTAAYHRLSRLLPDLQLAKGDGRYRKYLEALAKINVLVLDDFGLMPFTDEHRQDLLELIDDRYEKQATLVTSQLPIKHWHQTIGNNTLADAILDRLVHNSYRIEMEREVESMRKKPSKFTKEGNLP